VGILCRLTRVEALCPSTASLKNREFLKSTEASFDGDISTGGTNCAAEGLAEADIVDEGLRLADETIDGETDADGEGEPRGHAAHGEDLLDHLHDHAARDGVNGPLPDRDSQPGLGDPADAGPPLDHYLVLQEQFHLGGGMDLRPVGHIRVVPGVLDHVAGRRVVAQHAPLDTKACADPAGEHQLDLVDQHLVPQHLGSPLDGGGGAGACSVAVS